MDTFALIADERRRLADALAELDEADWLKPSLCGEWSNHQVAAHLNVPFTVSTSGFAVAMAKAFGNFDKANDRLARDLATRMDPAACIEGLRANAEHRFTPPGFGPEAPLCDVILHGGDILQPLGRSVALAPEASETALAFAVTPKAKRAFRAVAVDGLRLEATDADVSAGEGDAVAAGPALSLLGVLSGRSAYLPDLTGDGATVLRDRLAAAHP